MKKDKNKMEMEIERIKEALIGFNPEYFKVALCDHEPEQKYLQDLEGKFTSGMTGESYYVCKKCGCITDEFGKAIILRV